MTNSMQQTIGTDMSTDTQTGRTAPMENPLPKTGYPCPSWCDRPAGHPWESVSEDSGAHHLDRYHTLEVATVAAGTGDRDRLFVSIEAKEVVRAKPNLDDEPDAESHVDHPDLVLHWPDRPGLLTPDEASAFAEELGAAVRGGADRLRSLRD